jgi:hypothetical protein
LVSKDAWYELTLETPRADASEILKTSNGGEDLFNVDDFQSAHSDVSTPNDDDLHSARSLSSDGGNSRIVLNDGGSCSSFSTPRELGIGDTRDKKCGSQLHVSARLCWREHLVLCGLTAQSLHPVSLSGPILNLPSLNQLHFEKEVAVETSFSSHSHPNSDSAAAAGVGDQHRPMLDSEEDNNNENRNCSGGSSDVYEPVLRAELDEGDNRFCHYNKLLVLNKGVGCRVNAIAPAAAEVLVEYLAFCSSEGCTVADLQLELPRLNTKFPSRATQHAAPHLPSQSQYARSLISLFEYAHQALRSVSFSSADAMLLKHTVKHSFSVVLPFVAVDMYPPPPLIDPSFSKISHHGLFEFGAVRFVAGGFKYKIASQTDVSKKPE